MTVKFVLSLSVTATNSSSDAPIPHSLYPFRISSVRLSVRAGDQKLNLQLIDATWHKVRFVGMRNGRAAIKGFADVVCDHRRYHSLGDLPLQ